MDASLLLALISALFAGAALGFWASNHHTSGTLLLHPAIDVNPQSFANLITFLGDPSDTATLTTRSADWLRSNLSVLAVLLYVYDSAAQILTNATTSGATWSPLPRIRFGSGLFGEVANTREARLVERVEGDIRFGPTPTGAQDAYLLPLLAESQFLGVLCVFGSTGYFSAEQRREVDQYAALIGVQLLITRRYEDSQRAIARFDRFQSLAQQLVTQLDTQDLMQPIVNAARDMLDTQMSILLEVRSEDDKLYPAAWSGISEETALLLDSKLKEDLKGLVAWARLPARTPDLRTDQRTARATQAVVAGMVSELAAPIMYADKLYGILAVETDTYRNFSDEESNLLQSLAAQAGIALRNAQLYSRVRATNQQLEKALFDLRASQEEIERAHQAERHAIDTELETARQIQTSLLPQEMPTVSRLRVAARNIPARVVSGDFYQYVLLPGGRLGIGVGDVSGKGIPAALLMAVTTTALRDEVLQTGTAAGILNELNARLLDRMQSAQMNSALCLALFDPHTGYTEVANAGMVTPYLLNGRAWEAIEVGGYPLGAAQRSRYTSRNFVLTTGGMIVMISDGVIECQNPAGEFYGFDRFAALLNGITSNAEPESIIDQILDAITKYAAGREFEDDVTVVVIKSGGTT